MKIPFRSGHFSMSLLMRYMGITPLFVEISEEAQKQSNILLMNSDVSSDTSLIIEEKDVIKGRSD